MLFFSDGFSVREGFMAVKCKKTTTPKSERKKLLTQQENKYL
jgi:hypothetical protein